MAGKGSEKTQFKKGNKASPGRPKTPAAIRKIRTMNRFVLSELLTKYINCSLKELDVIAKDPTTPALELIVISAIKFSITKGDARSREFLIERMIGKVPLDVDLSGSFNIEHHGEVDHNITIHDRVVDIIKEVESKNE